MKGDDAGAVIYVQFQQFIQISSGAWAELPGKVNPAILHENGLTPDEIVWDEKYDSEIVYMAIEAPEGWIYYDQ